MVINDTRLFVSRGSSVGIVTAVDEVMVRLPTRIIDFFLFQMIQTGPGSHSVSYYLDLRLVPWRCRDWGVKLTNY